MKKYILVLLMIVSPLLGQEQDQKKLTTPYISLFTTIYGASDFKGFSTPIFGVGLEFMVGKKIYYYGKLQFNYRFNNAPTAPEIFMSPMAIQIQVLGIGFYLFDFRTSTNNKAWSMVMNISGGMGINLGHDGFKDWNEANNLDIFSQTAEGLGMMVYAPVEISLYARYHFSIISAVQFGLNIGGQLGGYNKFLYGFTVGFTF